jgi:hypothetical protein
MSGVLFTILCGWITNKSSLALYMVAPLGIGLLIAEIYILFSNKDNKFSNAYLKPATFYAYAYIFGATMGYTLTIVDGYERKV